MLRGHALEPVDTGPYPERGTFWSGIDGRLNASARADADAAGGGTEGHKRRVRDRERDSPAWACVVSDVHITDPALESTADCEGSARPIDPRVDVENSEDARAISIRLLSGRGIDALEHDRDCQ